MDTLDANTLEQAGGIIEGTASVVDRSVAFLRGVVSVDGRVDGAVLDRHQLVSYELAWSAAEVAASRALLEQAITRARESGGSTLEGRLAAAWIADTVQRVRSRLETCPQDFGFAREELTSLLGDDETRTFCAAQLSAGNLASIGEQVGVNGLGDLTAGLAAEHRMMADTFRRIADEVVEPLAEAIHREDRSIPDEILGPLNEMGLFGLSIPARYGGLCNDEQDDTMGMILATAELSRGSLGAAGSLVTRPEIVARSLLAGGTEEQKQTWLPRLAMGDPLCAVAVTEPDHGSDVAGMRLRASPVEGGWSLDGAKSWCTFGGQAGLLLVLARTESDPALEHRGLSLFLVEKPTYDGQEFEYVQDRGGRISGRAIATIGYRGMHSFDVWFDDYFVPDDHLIGGAGGRGKGFYHMMSGFAGGRIQTAARALGVMQAAFDQTRSYVAERKVFGQPIGRYQLSRVKLARMGMQLAASRALTFHVAGLLDRGRGTMEASLVKLYASRQAEQLTREAMQLHGGMGYAEETAVSRYFVDARVLSIFEGAEEVLALRVIARALLARAGE